jgi:peroxiredoxin
VQVLIDADGRVHELPGADGIVPSEALAAATGWEVKPEGLCRGEVCVPLFGRSVPATGPVELTGWAEALGLLAVLDGDVAAVVPSGAARADALRDGLAPPLELHDVHGNPVSLEDYAGRKRVLTTWASWCGCRHELGGWQQLQDELEPEGLVLISVALDEPEAARPWIEVAAPTFPAAVDPAHVTAEAFGIAQVPSSVWIDEDGRIVKPPTIAPGDDQFVDYTNVESARHHDAVRAWVRDGVLPESAATDVEPRTDDQQLALAERRVAAHFQRTGDPEAARGHLARAAELAPGDWTVRRGGIALTGGDPFLGEEVRALGDEGNGAGRPGYRPT